MSQLLEDTYPPVQGAGLNTNRNAAFGGTVTITGAVGLVNKVTALNATATTSGGATTPALAMGTALVGVYFGSNAPSISAPQGSIYLRTDGSSSSTRLYVNTNGSTSWTAVTTAA